MMVKECGFVQRRIGRHRKMSDSAHNRAAFLKLRPFYDSPSTAPGFLMFEAFVACADAPLSPLDCPLHGVGG
jgi:hypothetical protein